MKYILLHFFLAAIPIGCLGQVSGSIQLPTVCSPSEILVAKVNLNKGSVSGVGKLELQIPSGLQFTDVGLDAGATVRHSNDIVKFLWLDLPTDDQLETTFRFKVISEKSGIQTITGSFSYRVDDKTQTEQLPASNIEIVVESVKKGESPVSEEPVVTESVDATSPVSDESEEVIDNKVQQPASAKVEAKQDEPTEDNEINAEYDKALFHVQVASSKTGLTEFDLKKRFPTTRQIIVLPYEGGYKYAVEKLKTYEAAKKLCADLKASGEFSDCFVTSSFKGTYLPLQDAIKMNR